MREPTINSTHMEIKLGPGIKLKPQKSRWESAITKGAGIAQW